MIRFLLNIYITILIIDTILSYFPQYKYRPWAIKLKELADLSLKPVRKILPPGLPFDISPLVVILLIQLIVILF